MKNIRKLIPAMAMLLLSAVLLSTSSFAWFSMSTSVQVSSMSIKATTSTGIFQASPAAKSNWLTTAVPLSYDENLTLSPTTVGEALTDANFTFTGNYSNDAALPVEEGGASREAQVGKLLSTDTSGYSGVATANDNTSPTVLTMYTSTTNIAIWGHFFLASEGEGQKMTCQIKGTKPEAADVFAGCVTVEIWTDETVGATTNLAKAAEFKLDSLTATDTLQTIGDELVLDSIGNGGTEVWIIMYFDGVDTGCTTAAASANVFGELSFQFNLVASNN